MQEEVIHFSFLVWMQYVQFTIVQGIQKCKFLEKVHVQYITAKEKKL